MNKFFLISAFLSWASVAQAEVITLTPSGGGVGGGTLTSGTTPVSGCSPGQFLYNNSGLLGCQSGSGGMSINGPVIGGTAGQGLYVAAGPVLAQFAYGAGVFTAMQVAADTTGGVVLLNGTPTSGDLLQWSATGAQDSNVAASSVVTLGATQTLTNKTLTSPAFTGTVTGAGTIPVGVISASGTPSSTTFLRGDGTWNAVSGGITGPGTTVSGNLVTWNSTTGAAVADSGISLGNVALTTAANTFNQRQSVASSTQFSGFNGNNGTNGTFSLQGSSATNDNGTLSLNNAGVTGVSLRASGSGYINNGVGLSIGTTSTPVYPLDVVGNIHTTTGLLINGTSVIDTINSGNSSAQARTITFPNTGNVSDTLALLAATQTFSGAVTHSGTTQFSGAGPASGPAANTTWAQGGSTAPTLGSNAGVLTIGGAYTATTLSTAGQGAIFLSATNGLQLQGNPQIAFEAANGTIYAYVNGNGLYTRSGFLNGSSNHIWDSVTAPTWNAGFGGTTTVGTQNGTRTFQVTVPASPSGSTGTVNLTAANTNWNCYANDITNPGTVVVAQTGWATNTAQFTAYSRTTGTPVTWTAADVIEISCSGL